MAQGKGNKKPTQSLITQGKCMEMIAQGMSHKQVVEALQADGMTYKNASTYYYLTLKEMLPDPQYFEDYKQSLTQKNIERLEGIVDDTISGDTAEKNTAIRAIEVMNKMCGIQDGSKVNIAKSKDGDEVIQIVFNK